MFKNYNVPWVRYESASWRPFYVDVLHAVNLKTQKELEELLSIESEEEFIYQLNKLCLSPIMRKTYTIYDILLGSEQNKK